MDCIIRELLLIANASREMEKVLESNICYLYDLGMKKEDGEGFERVESFLTDLERKLNSICYKLAAKE